MNELKALADKYGSDKGSLKHNYTEHYFKYFEPIRHRPLNILEIGVDKGASIEMWLDFFPSAGNAMEDLVDRFGFRKLDTQLTVLEV